MSKDYKVLGKARVIKSKLDGTAKAQITEELDSDLPMYGTFIAMHIELFAKKSNLSIADALKLLKQNIETEPMNFE